jgi:hypothetical protein
VRGTQTVFVLVRGTREPDFFTVASTVCEIFAAKLRNSAQRHANQLASGQL